MEARGSTRLTPSLFLEQTGGFDIYRRQPTRGVSAEKLDRHPFRTLLLFLALGSGIFSAGLFLILFSVGSVGHTNLDPTAVYFYPVVAGAGALFGLERWLYYESGGVNPFHDR